MASETERLTSIDGAMFLDPTTLARLAGAIFAIVALLQLMRALAGWRWAERKFSCGQVGWLA